MAKVDEVGVLQSPFPIHDWTFSIETDGIHDGGTQIKWRNFSLEEDIFWRYWEMVVARLLDRILAQFILW